MEVFLWFPFNPQKRHCPLPLLCAKVPWSGDGMGLGDVASGAVGAVGGFLGGAAGDPSRVKEGERRRPSGKPGGTFKHPTGAWF